jgi:hypothetical protein
MVRIMSESRRRREAILRGEPDPGVVGYRAPAPKTLGKMLSMWASNRHKRRVEAPRSERAAKPPLDAPFANGPKNKSKWRAPTSYLRVEDFRGNEMLLPSFASRRWRKPSRDEWLAKTTRPRKNGQPR